MLAHVSSDLDEIGRRQYGLVGVGQLRRMGWDRQAVHRLVLSGRLSLVRPGVYRLCGAAPSWRSSALAALMAAGTEAVLSHGSAGALWGLPGLDRRPALEVTSTRQLRMEGVVGHRHALRPEETTVRFFIPVTTVERTLLDLADTATAPEVGRLIDDALRRELTSIGRISAAIQGHTGRGRRRLGSIRDALADRGALYDPGANDWERAMDAMWVRLGLPAAERQYRIEVGGGRWYRPDRAVVDARIAVDWNGFAAHGDRDRFDYDSDRRARLAAAGWYPLDFTSRSDPALICRTVLAVYAERRQMLGLSH